MRARAAAAALAALCLLPATAAARESQPVVGGGSFNAAPILGPGRYHDTVLPDEFLYYGIRLQPGQRLHVRATLGLPSADVGDLGLSDVAAVLEAPDRTVLAGPNGPAGVASTPGSDDQPIDIVGRPVGTGRGDTDTESTWTGPGTYFVSFHADYTAAGTPPRAEVPIDFELAVEGAAAPQATPTRTPPATPTPTPTPTAADDASGASTAAAAGITLAGLLIGGGAGLALRRRR